MRRLPLALTTFVVALLAGPRPAAAQHEASAALLISDPRGEFDDHTDTGFGLGATYLYALHPSRAISIGATGSFMNYGNTDREVPLSTTIPDIRVEVETSNNMFFLQGALQVKAPAGLVQPYALATGGFGFFATTTTLKDRLTEEQILSDTNQSDGTWVYGAGGGAQIRVWTGEARAGDSEPSRAYVDLGARWLRGGEVEYLTEGSLVTDDGEFDIDERLVNSEIELVEYRIGVTFEF